jgi:hypothetical protein
MTPALPTTGAPTGTGVDWVYDPWRERPRMAAAAALCALALCALVLALRLPFVLAAGLCVAGVSSFSPALTPFECRLDPDGAARRGPLGWERRRWADVRRAEEVPAGVLLSPYPSRHWLDGPRGLLLPLPSERRAELVRAIARHRGSDVA